MTWNMHSMIAVVMIIAGGEGAERCVAQSGARGVAVSTQRAAQPYEFAYDHVSGELGSQDDLFMRECRCPLLQLRANPVLQMLVDAHQTIMPCSSQYADTAISGQQASGKCDARQLPPDRLVLRITTVADFDFDL